MTSLPYVRDLEKWRMDMARGKTRPDHTGYYLVDRVQTRGDDSCHPQIQIVTPVAQAVELAISELAIENERTPKVYKRKMPSKRKTYKKTAKLERKIDDVFPKNG
jgi:hypothetical protein